MRLVKPLTAENFILCLILNFENIRFSQKFTNYLLYVGRKFLKLSQFYFTLLPTSEFLLLRKKSSRVNVSRFIFILTSYLVSSIPEWLKLILFFETKDFWNHQREPIKCLVSLFLITYIDIRTPICYKLHAPFLLDNSIGMNLQNYSYGETNIVQDLRISMQVFFSQSNMDSG